MMALVTGGASCGKSALAEGLAVALGGRLVYLATMRPAGDEGARRVACHRAQRAGKEFATVECYGRLEDALSTGCFDGATVLLEDLGNLVANELFGDGDGLPGADAAHDDVAALAKRAENLVVVGNEVGCDGRSYGPEVRAYQEELGRVACEVAALSDLVIDCAAGMPSVIKAPAGHGIFADPARGRLVEKFEAAQSERAAQRNAHGREKGGGLMMLVTGGIASGKRAYLRSLGYGQRDMSADVSGKHAVLLDAQELVRNASVDIEGLAGQIALNKQAVAIVEVGLGIVPAEPEDRAWRDRAGMLARELAARSDVVVRMVCGVPAALKGKLPEP